MRRAGRYADAMAGYDRLAGDAIPITWTAITGARSAAHSDSVRGRDDRIPCTRWRCARPRRRAFGHRAAARSQGGAEAAIASSTAPLPCSRRISNRAVDRANALFKLGRLPEAIAEWDRDLALDPDKWRPHGRGNCCMRRATAKRRSPNMTGRSSSHRISLARPTTARWCSSPWAAWTRPSPAYQWASGSSPTLPRRCSTARYCWAIAIATTNPGHVRAVLAVDPEFPHAVGNVALERAYSCAGGRTAKRRCGGCRRG